MSDYDYGTPEEDIKRLENMVIKEYKARHLLHSVLRIDYPDVWMELIDKKVV